MLFYSKSVRTFFKLRICSNQPLFSKPLFLAVDRKGIIPTKEKLSASIRSKGSFLEGIMLCVYV